MFTLQTQRQEFLSNSMMNNPEPISNFHTHKWRTIFLLSLAELFVMCVWFSASAVVPALTKAWQLDGSGQAWLTMSVQMGFVIGALGSAVFNLADRIASRRLFAASAILSALVTVLIPLFANGIARALVLRLLTGILLAGVYPVGMKIMATWTKEDRGVAIGLLVGALTLGSAMPHLLKVFGDVEAWQTVLYMAAGLAMTGGLLAAFFITEGPYQTETPPFNWKYVGRIFRQKELVLANLGYLGHMWELYAMWTWVPIFLLASFDLTGTNPRWASAAGFAVIAVGSIGCFWAGYMADRYGRTIITSAAMALSGSCALIVGFLFGFHPWIVVIVCLIWGFTIVADSAQFSAAISELSQSEYVGTALTLQTSMGFLLTLMTIRIVPALEQHVGWRFAFMILAIGPVVGIWAMTALRRSPEAVKLAGGRR